LLDFLLNQDYTIIAVAIDKIGQKEKYGKNSYNPYHFGLDLLLERYCGYLDHFDSFGDVMAESRGKREDLMLEGEYQNIYNFGTYFHASDLFQKTLTSQKLKLKKKEANISGLQIADLLAAEANKQILLENKILDDKRKPFAKAICCAINGKFNRSPYDGRMKGYGKIIRIFS
jgi:hypothetical protein